MNTISFPPSFQSVLDEFIPIIHHLAGNQRYAISVGGSIGKGTWDACSDIDFRLYTDERIPWEDTHPELWAEVFSACNRRKEQGIYVDGVWARTTDEINSALDAWLSGDINPVHLIWTIWGYHLLTDIACQAIIEDPYDILKDWKDRLRVYPSKLKQAILSKYCASLSYWRHDYHYAHKVERGDIVFLAGMTSKLVHEMLQILFAINDTYFPGDGSNLTLAEKFLVCPVNFKARVERILYPHTDSFRAQYQDLVALIDEVIALTG